MRLRHRFQTLIVLFALSIPSWAQSTAGEFTVITLPDTQNYAQYYPKIFTSQTQWIAANAKAMHLQFVVGLGDIVNNGSDVAQYANADAAYRLLDNAAIPYFAAIGNHDYKNATPMTRDASVFNSFFGPSRYAQKSYYRGNFPNGSNENFYGVFNISGTPYLVLALEFVPRDSVVEWASSVISENLDKKIIIVTHGYLTPAGLRQGHCDENSAEFFALAGDNDADALWTKLISKYPNITMVLNGHDTGYASRQDLGVNGNLVNQIVSDYQDWADGGGGYLRIMTFKPALNRIDVTTYSPYYNKYLTDAGNQFSLSLAPTTTTGAGSVRGIVRNQNTCAAIGGVLVKANGGQGTSNSSGYYQTTASSGASQSVTASGSGLTSNTEIINVGGGYSSQLNYFMVPSGAATGSITISTPSDGANVVSPMQLKAAGNSSAGAITFMEIYDQDTLVYSTSGSSLATSLSLSPGGHQLIVQGMDAHGNWFKSPINVVVQQTGSVTMTSPLNNGYVSSPVLVTGEADSSQGISAMQIYEDNQLVYTAAANRVSTSVPMTQGNHYIVLQAFGATGSIYKSSANVTVAAPATGVTVTLPAQGAVVASPVTVVASAASSKPIAAMQIYADNKLVYQVTGSTINTSIPLPPGAHVLAIKAWDISDGTELGLKNITVTN